MLQLELKCSETKRAKKVSKMFQIDMKVKWYLTKEGGSVVSSVAQYVHVRSYIVARPNCGFIAPFLELAVIDPNTLNKPYESSNHSVFGIIFVLFLLVFMNIA